MFRTFGSDLGWNVSFTEDSTWFSASNLNQTDVVVFLMTSGDVFTVSQETAFQEYMLGGGGYVGVHSASDTEYGWSWYGEHLIGTYFSGHPHQQTATTQVWNLVNDSLTSGLITKFFFNGSDANAPWYSWERFDEWYNFRISVRNNTNLTRLAVLASLDEGTYSGGDMGADHPIIWTNELNSSTPSGVSGRMVYIGGGHTAESYSEAQFVRVISNSVLWAARRLPSSSVVPRPTTTPRPNPDSPSSSSQAVVSPLMILSTLALQMLVATQLF